MVVMHIETTTAGLLIALGAGRPKARILKTRTSGPTA